MEKREIGNNTTAFWDGQTVWVTQMKGGQEISVSLKLDSIDQLTEYAKRVTQKEHKNERPNNTNR